MSDGTNSLTFLNPNTLRPTRIVNVTENGIPRDSLNELEFINGYIYANIWLNDHIVKIDPVNGNVVGRLDLTALTRDAVSENPNADALNGIAYDSCTKKIFVTGKMWKNIYEIEFIP
jgi:glutamine cyclotransferase